MSEEIPKGAILWVWRPDWNCYHAGVYVGGEKNIVHFWAEWPDRVIEISDDGGKSWRKAPLFDFRFLQTVWGDLIMREVKS